MSEKNEKLIERQPQKNDDKRNRKRINKTHENNYDYSEIEKMLPEEFDKLFTTLPLTDETTCGFWIFKGSFLQRLANKKAYVFLYGVTGCLFAATYAYFNATISTLEKRYKIPSRNTGIISVGNDISQMLVSSVLTYYAGKGHRPRWMAVGLTTVTIFCFMNAFPHLLYGPGEDALALTTEHGATFDVNSTNSEIETQRRKTLCRLNSTEGVECEVGEGNLAPQLILFVAQLISGLGQPLYYSLGTAYMDDNIQKSKTPTFISLSYFLRMLGPALGYTLASFCLNLYISPYLTPTINSLDQRWLGAWWLGWVVLGLSMCCSAMLLAMFPKTLPRAAVRKVIHKEKIRRNLSINAPEPDKASLKDMLRTFKRLLMNVTLMFNNISSLFYYFGYLPYWIFMAKYMETQYRQSAAVSSLVTGTVPLAFSAIGILVSGLVLSKFKPSARYMAAWNVICGLISVLGILSYTMLGCSDNDSKVVINYSSSLDLTPTCNSNCNCDYVKYAPVCGDDGNSYISPCHAGCTEQTIEGDKKIFTNCACIPANNNLNISSLPIYERMTLLNQTTTDLSSLNGTFGTSLFENSFSNGRAVGGSCPVNCFKEFVAFLAVMCTLKFVGATGRATNFLVAVRCVEEKDKTVAMGFSLMFMSLFAFIPSPIFFGSLMDRTCLVWGKTCSGNGNCWLYDGETLRWYMNTIAAAFVFVGTLFDAGVWYYVKDLEIFDAEETELKDLSQKEESEEIITKKPTLVTTTTPIESNNVNNVKSTNEEEKS